MKRRHQGFGDTFYFDAVFVKIQGQQQYLWRAVDQDGEVVDVFLQARRDGKAAKRFFKRLLKNHHDEPRKIVTDKLRSYGVAHRELILDAIHDTTQYANNRARGFASADSGPRAGMRRFKSTHDCRDAGGRTNQDAYMEVSGRNRLEQVFETESSKPNAF